jgi:triacylglycerol esterase/lipase EstA (alpha/beta hydrolase family)
MALGGGAFYFIGRDGLRMVSTFRRSLDNELKDHSLDGTVRAFLWSGANSVTARASAAIKLSEELEMVLREPNTRPVVIAHSHGGNVVLCALKHLTLEKKRIRFIALATPFI